MRKIFTSAIVATAILSVSAFATTNDFVNDSWVHAISTTRDLRYYASAEFPSGKDSCLALGKVYGRAQELGKTLLRDINVWHLKDQKLDIEIRTSAERIQSYASIDRCDVARMQLKYFRAEVDNLKANLDKAIPKP